MSKYGKSEEYPNIVNDGHEVEEAEVWEFSWTEHAHAQYYTEDLMVPYHANCCHHVTVDFLIFYLF